MFRRMRWTALAVLAAAAAVLATAGTAGAYTTDPGYHASDFATGFANQGTNRVGPVGLAWDATNHLYVMDYYNGLLYKFDSSGGVADAAHQVTVGASPWGANNAAGIAFSKSGRLYVALQSSGRVDEIDPADGHILRSIYNTLVFPFGTFDFPIDCATGIATNPITGDMLVSDPCGANPSTLIQNPDSASPTVVGNQVPVWADGITFAPDGSIWTTSVGTTLQHIDSTGVHNVATISTLDGTAVSSAGDGSVFANTNDGRVVKYDPSTGTQTTIFSGGSRGDFSTVGPDGCLYITQTDRIVKITNADGTCSWSPTTALPTITLAPTAQTHHVGETATVTATLANVPSPAGTTLDVSVTGANPQTTTATVAADGTVAIDLTATSQGDDQVSVSATIDGQEVSSNVADITWEAPLDTTPPTITAAATTDPNENGWYSGDVTVHFTCSDDGSGITAGACPPDQVLTDEGSAVSSTAETVTDAAGNTSDPSNVVTVQIDRTAPTVTYTPAAGTYDVDQTVTIACTAADNLSGVASDTCVDVNAPAWSLGLGSHDLSASATDNAGNIGYGSATFTVVVTDDGLCGLVQRWTSNAGVANSLCVKLASGAYGAFRNEVSAQRGKKISAAHADELIALSRAL